MSLFFILIFLCFTYSLNSINSQNEIILSEESNTSSIGNCLLKFHINNFTDIIDFINKNDTEKKYELVICLLNSDDLLDKLRDIKDIYNLLKLIYGNKIEEFCNITKIPHLYMIIDDLMTNETNKIFDGIIEILSNSSNNIIGFITEILKQGKSITYTKSFEILKKIFNIQNVYELFNTSYYRYKDYFMDLVEYFSQNTKLSNIFQMLKNFLKKFLDILIQLFYGIIKYFEDYKNIANFLGDFIIQNNNDRNKETSLIESLREISKNQTILDEIIKISEYNFLADYIVTEIINNTEIFDFALNFLYNDSFIKNISEIIIKSDNKTEYSYLIPIFVDDFFNDNETNVKILVDITVKVIEGLVRKNGFNQFISKDVAKKIGKYFDGKKKENLNPISDNCYNLFDYIFFQKYSDNIRDFRYFYVKKLFIETSKNKNDFLTYENCLGENNNFNNYSGFYNIKPIFLIGIINDKVNNNKLKDSIYKEKYNYLYSICIPYGSYQGSSLCNANDYNSLIKLFCGMSFSMNTSSIDSFFLDNKSLQMNNRDYLYLFITLIILFLPLLIKFFLIIYNKCKLRKPFKVDNKLNDKEEKSHNSINEENIMEEENNTNINFPKPKWYILLNEYFIGNKNDRELFNFSLVETKYNNLNGITYIKGLFGMSMIFVIFGQTFSILLDLPSKVFGAYNFYSTVKNPIYSIIFIALRYSPRFLFSCSSNILVYKYLCFIEKEADFSSIKFIFAQSYKYILLILVAIFVRFSIYYIVVFINDGRNPMIELFKNRLEKNNSNYFYNLFSFLFYNLFNREFEKEQSAIQYLYIPINEVILFIFGVLLISLGFRCKVRIDIIIIVIFLLIYLFRIIFFFTFLNQEKLYPTLYFNSSGYGALMLNPIYNLPYFLIGMFFGLVNYTIQRGINTQNLEERNTKLELLEPFKDLNFKEQTSLSFKENSVKNLESYKSFGSEIVTSINRTETYDNQNISPLGLKTDSEGLINKLYDEEIEKQDLKEDYTIKQINYDIINEMPFLKAPIAFTNFFRNNQDKLYLKVILAIFFIIIIFFALLKFFYFKFYIEIFGTSDIKNNDIQALDSIIPNYFFNVIYLIDIELVIFMMNWICFYFYFKGGQINDFLNHIYWSFFVKSYFSYILVMSPFILFLFYQSETMITITLYDIILYSSISIFFVLILTVIFYSLFELPCRKIFKSLKKMERNTINLENDDYFDDQTDGE